MALRLGKECVIGGRQAQTVLRSNVEGEPLILLVLVLKRDTMKQVQAEIYFLIDSKGKRVPFL